MATMDLDCFGKRPKADDEDKLSIFSGAGRSLVSADALRILDPSVDQFVISHVLAGGQWERYDTSAQEPCWTLANDGVMVVAKERFDEASDLNSWLRSSFQVAFFSALDARDAYAALLERLDAALDEEDRLDRLHHVLATGNRQGITRTFHGVDLSVHPTNRPLLLHCAAEGYSQCLHALIQAGFAPDVHGSNKCSALHLAAWGGHTDCVELLCQKCPQLSEETNKWREFPELAAYGRACELDIAGEVSSKRFYQAGERCLQTRKGNAELDKTWFQDDSKERLQHCFQASIKNVRISPGTRPADIAAAASQMTSDWRVTDLSVAFVDLRGVEVLDVLLSAAAQGHFLQHLQLEGCGLGRPEAACLRTFLERRTTSLAKLDLSSNPLGDGVVELFCPALFRVKDVVLDNTKLSETTVGCFGEQLACAMDVEVVSLDSIHFARNDLSHVGDLDANAGFGSFLQVLCQKSCPLRKLYLDHTRLSRQQLEGLVNALPNFGLVTLSCHGLCLPAEWAAKGGKLNQALHHDRCVLKRIEVDRGQGSEEFDKLWKAIKLRDAAREQPRGQKGKGKSKGKDKKGKGCNDISGRSSSSTGREEVQHSFSFREPFAVCLRAVYWDARRSSWKGDFLTESAGAVAGVLLPRTGDSHPEADVNSVFNMTLKLQRAPETVDKSLKSTDLAVDSMQQETSRSRHFLEFVRLVFVRESTSQILTLSASFSPAALQLKQVFMLDSFRGLPDLPTEMIPQLGHLLSKLTDAELLSLLDSGVADSLLHPWSGKTGKFVDDVARSQHRARVSSPAWQALSKLAEAEKASRQKPNEMVELRRMLTFRLACQLQSGASTSSRMSYDDPEKAFLQELHRTTLRGSGVHITRQRDGGGKKETTDVVDCTGKMLQRLLFCSIPERLINDESPNGPVKWLPDSRWVSASTPGVLSAILHDDASEGYPSLAESICAAVMKLRPGNIDYTVGNDHQS
ncbi:hypothetical protein AK812_SmicGene25503 [Symbiodinium microadriaticum]|uniref:Uncharacterized protein n=1 Tax=Symbiodinium microadriaticum TaxID=2951 RepID=A0A1Q9DC19_SYMMI|nr:hypothetical protein AK812_SmicGene25503 [Symbiodinium microadriaticum]